VDCYRSRLRERNLMLYRLGYGRALEMKR